MPSFSPSRRGFGTPHSSSCRARWSSPSPCPGHNPAMTASPTPAIGPYTPRRPHLAALGVVSLFIFILALPMLSGKWLASPDGDQYSSGYAVKQWAAKEYHQTGHFPGLNPMIMGGLPYIAVVTHGDVLYPTSFLREGMPPYQAMNI